MIAVNYPTPFAGYPDFEYPKAEFRPSGYKVIRRKVHKCKHAPLGFLENLALDDIIIIGLIVILLMEEVEERDYATIAALVFLFFP
ncbi:MAG: hypothetical protein LBL34_07025 [Clostridiales bacterium]|jgi:hypothetical protein|nr:hypothetical protein [Clostridiales bacterium]